MPTTGDTHRTVSMWSCGIGLSHHALMLILASRTVRAPNTTETVGTRSYERAPRPTRRGLNHFPRRVLIARRVLGVAEPLVARGPRLPLTFACVLPRACVCALVWPATARLHKQFPVWDAGRRKTTANSNDVIVSRIIEVIPSPELPPKRVGINAREEEVGTSR